MSSNQKAFMIFAVCFTVTCLINFPITQANDEQVVIKMCGATDMPTVCKSCIDNSGREVDQDLDVIVGAVRCTYDDTSDLIDNATQIVKDTEDDTVKKVIGGCGQDYKDVQDGLMKIVQEASKRSFVTAKGMLDTLIYPKMNACNDAINQSGIAMPPELFGHLVGVGGDYNMLSQLLTIIKA